MQDAAKAIISAFGVQTDFMPTQSAAPEFEGIAENSENEQARGNERPNGSDISCHLDGFVHLKGHIAVDSAGVCKDKDADGNCCGPLIFAGNDDVDNCEMCAAKCDKIDDCKAYVCTESNKCYMQASVRPKAGQGTVSGPFCAKYNSIQKSMICNAETNPTKMGFWDMKMGAFSPQYTEPTFAKADAKQQYGPGCSGYPGVPGIMLDLGILGPSHEFASWGAIGGGVSLAIVFPICEGCLPYFVLNVGLGVDFTMPGDPDPCQPVQATYTSSQTCFAASSACEWVKSRDAKSTNGYQCKKKKGRSMGLGEGVSLGLIFWHSYALGRAGNIDVHLPKWIQDQTGGWIDSITIPMSDPLGGHTYKDKDLSAADRVRPVASSCLSIRHAIVTEMITRFGLHELSLTWSCWLECIYCLTNRLCKNSEL